jgi:prevent-host-death family protein
MIVVMEILPLADVKARLSEVVGRVAGEHDRVTITRNGRPAAVLVSPDDLEGLEETLAILSQPGALDEIRQAHEAIAAGDAVNLDTLAARYRPR